MKNIKNIFFALFIILFIIFTLTSCAADNADKNGGRLKIVATLFPQYDFARQIAGDKADVKLLLPPGVESHSFDPKPSDMLEIYNADLFIYTGANMEPWAETIIKGAKNENLAVLDCSCNVELLHDDDDEHEHGADPHIWLNLKFAQIMVSDIMHSLCALDPDNADYYRENAQNYIEKLKKLDSDIFDVRNNGKRNIIVFGGRFSYIYFLTYYNLDYVTAYDSCSSQAEPSVSRVAEIIDFIRQNNIPCIYYEELADPKIAKSIANETGIEYLLFSTAHNVTKSEFDEGVTFLDIMYMNLENLKKGLN